MLKYKLAEAFVQFVARGGPQVQHVVNTLGGSVDQFGQRLRTVDALFNNSFLGLGGMGSLLAGGAGGAGAGLLLRLASQAEEANSKFRAVFREQSELVDAWADDFGNAVGRSAQSLKGFLATLQDTFVPLGFARGEARRMSQELTKLAVDLASFNNLAEADVVNNLTSALVGNHMAVRRFGIILSETALNQELLNMGIQGGIRAATDQEKVQARLSIIMKSSGDAIGDAERTAGSFANQLRKLRDGAADLGRTMGDRLMQPGGRVLELLNGLVDRLKGLNPATVDQIATWGTFAVALGGIVTLGPKVIAVLGGIGVAMSGLLGPLGLTIAGISALAAVFITAKARGEDFGDTLARLLGLMREFDEQQAQEDALRDIMQSGERAVRTGGESAPELLESQIEAARKKAEELERQAAAARQELTEAEGLVKRFGPAEFSLRPVGSKPIEQLQREVEAAEGLAEQARLYEKRLSELRNEAQATADKAKAEQEAAEAAEKSLSIQQELARIAKEQSQERLRREFEQEQRERDQAERRRQQDRLKTFFGAQAAIGAARDTAVGRALDALDPNRFKASAELDKARAEAEKLSGAARERAMKELALFEELERMLHERAVEEAERPRGERLGISDLADRLQAAALDNRDAEQFRRKVQTVLTNMVQKGIKITNLNEIKPTAIVAPG